MCTIIMGLWKKIEILGLLFCVEEEMWENSYICLYFSALDFILSRNLLKETLMD